MASSPQPSSPFRFGAFELDPSTGELRKSGISIRLHPQPFRLLLMLLERPAQIVTREEIRSSLWGDNTFVDFDRSINFCVNQIRGALGDDAEKPRFVETLPRRGYRFIAPVELLSAPSARPRLVPIPEIRPATDAAGPGPARAKRRRFARAPLVLAAACLVGLLAGLALYVWFAPPSVPRVIRVTRLTHSGRVETWARLVSDGARIYFLEQNGDHWNLAQTSASGAEPQLISAPFRNTRVLDVSPDRTEFLIASFVGRESEMPLWLWPVQGGAPRRLGDVLATDAMWCPGGQRVVYAHGTDLHLVDKDGSNDRKLISVAGSPSHLAWSPDGRVLRFSVWAQTFFSIWEVAADGTHLHRLLENRNYPPDECCGQWTSDGKYFLFASGRGGKPNIWAIREKPGLFARNPEPVQLTLGSGDFLDPLTDLTRGRAYIMVSNSRADFARFDLKSREFVPILKDLQGLTLSYSPDGEWIAYVTSDGALWRSRAGGSERVQLTVPPLRTSDPRWSPDGKRIVFWGWYSGHPDRIYLVSSEGGKPQELLAEKRGQSRPVWSPDGNSIAYELQEDSPSAVGIAAIHVFELSSQHDVKLPGGDDLIAPAWSPDGKYLAAVTLKQRELMLFTFATQKWEKLTSGTLLTGIHWEKDSKSLFVQDLLEAGQPVYRVRLADGARERVVDFEPLLRAGAVRCGFTGLSPQGDPLASVARSSADIEALDLDLP
jgi:Tol biopolymer transport system component/DNA-binding winged helix-turn-helix (wHTH) protein